jgi:hypothetical protein
MNEFFTVLDKIKDYTCLPSEDIAVSRVSGFTEVNLNEAPYVEIKDILRNLGIVDRCVGLLFVNTSEGQGTLWHTDESNKEPAFCGINFPLINCGNSEMRWSLGDAKFYRQLKAKRLDKDVDYSMCATARMPFRQADMESQVSESLVLDRPTLVRTDCFHSVRWRNRGPQEERVLLSVRLLSNPTYEELYTRLAGVGFDKGVS